MIDDAVILDELATARAISSGELPSPQRIGDLSLYAMRVSGTGVSYRRGIDEYVWRDPAIYLSQDMIDRCAGLPVIWEHPPKSMLNSEEFANRVVGTVMFAYPKRDELWGISRIYDKEAMEMMDAEQLSTSPAVVFKDPTVNSKIEMEDGSKMLVEGKPSLLDHLAVCAKGVWDKGGKPTGIENVEVKMDSDMNGNGTIFNFNFPPNSVPRELAHGANERGQTRNDSMEKEDKKDAVKKDWDEKKEEKEEKKDTAQADAAAAKADAEAGQKIDKILASLDSILADSAKLHSRMDAYEAKKDGAEAAMDKKDKKKDADKPEEEEGKAERIPFTKDSKKKDAEEECEEKGDPKELKADKKKDAEEKEEKEEKEKKDAARMDSDFADLKKQFDEFRSLSPRQISDEDRDALSVSQSKADEIYSAFGDSAPRPMQNELPIEYRRRIATKLKTHSPAFKDEDIKALALHPKAFQIAEDQIYKDAWAAATTPDDTAGLELREVRRRNDSGHMIKEFYGQPMAWMQQFTGGRRLARFNLGKARGDR